MNIFKFQKDNKIRFKKKSLLIQALTHKSADQKNNNEKLDNICEECKKEDESVKQNLIMHSYKICSSCNLAKTIFPI